VGEDGKPQQSMRGLGIQTTDSWGQKLSGADLESEMLAKKIRAITEWNRVDQSSKPRLQVPESLGQAKTEVLERLRYLVC